MKPQRLSQQCNSTCKPIRSFVAELKARIQTVIAYLATFTEEDFAGAADRAVLLPFAPGMQIAGSDYRST